MGSEDRILDAIASLAAATQKGFAEITGRFEGIEARLDAQEKTTKATRLRQDIQSADIEQLKQIVQELAEKEPLRRLPGGTAIRRDEAYERFTEKEISTRKAMRALRESGTIRIDPEGKNTCTIRLDGQPQRVIIVNIENKGE